MFLQLLPAEPKFPSWQPLRRERVWCPGSAEPPRSRGDRHETREERDLLGHSRAAPAQEQRERPRRPAHSRAQHPGARGCHTGGTARRRGTRLSQHPPDSPAAPSRPSPLTSLQTPRHAPETSRNGWDWQRNPGPRGGRHPTAARARWEAVGHGGNTGGAISR